MKWKSIAAALGAMLLASTVFAEESFVHGQAPHAKDRPHVGTFVGGMYASDSTGYIFGVDANGRLLTEDADRDRDLALDDATPILSTSLTAIGAADSSTVLDLSGYALTGLAVSVSGRADLIVQIRYCRDGVDDSTHTFPIGIVQSDSLKLARRPLIYVQGSSLGAHNTEFVLPFAAIGTYGPLRRALIPLADLLERPRLDHISVRVRLAACDDATNPKVVQIYAVGSALR